jgi:hypothetical protein
LGLDFGKNHGTGKMDRVKQRMKQDHARFDHIHLRSHHLMGACPCQDESAGYPVALVALHLVRAAHGEPGHTTQTWSEAASTPVRTMKLARTGGIQVCGKKGFDMSAI